MSESKKIENELNTKSIDEEISKKNKVIKQLLNRLKVVDDDEVAKIIIEEITSIKNALKELEDQKVKNLDKQSELVIAETEIIKAINELDDFNNSFDELSHEQKQIRLKDLLESITYKENAFEIKFRVKKNLLMV